MEQKVDRLILRARGIAVLRGVLDSPAAQDLLSLLEILGQERPDPARLSETFGRLWEELATESGNLLPDSWQSHLVERILEDENPFSLGAERGELSPGVTEQARRDLRALQALFEFDGETLLRLIEDRFPELSGLWVPWTDQTRNEEYSLRQEIARKLKAAGDWGECVEMFARHFALGGTGIFGRYRAFRWRERTLVPIENPDSVRLETLITYESEREPLVENTKRLLAGAPAHHVLLYGPPGTGKSSTVKAIANEYASAGLRLVEVAKEDLGELPQVLGALRDRGPRFIVFVDDLSFEEHEVEYKTLKALLEGTAERPPDNVRLYATSNRRNIVRERFSEREDDVHARDTEQEKFSLAARFGLRLSFPAPDQRRYLQIVTGLARQRGIDIPEEDIRERALLWDRWHAGRSGRTARQFVDELEADNLT